MNKCQHFICGQTQGVLGHSDRFETPWHCHDHVVVGMVDAGFQTIHLRKGVYKIEPNTGFVIPRGLAHKCLFGPNTKYRILCIPFAELEDIQTFSILREPNGKKIFDRVFDHLRHGTATPVSQLLACFDSAVECALQQTNPVPVFVQKALVDVMSDLEDQKVLNKLARRQHISPFYFQRTFLKHIGLSPSQARLVARIKACRQDLACGRKPTDIAYKYGFADQSHMTRTFEKFMGVSPKFYQKQLTQKSQDEKR